MENNKKKKIPNNEPRYCVEGCIRLIVHIAKDAGEEYRNAKRAVSAAEKSGNVYAIESAKARFARISEFMEGYELDAGRDRAVLTDTPMRKQDFERLYVLDVLNDPNKNNTDPRIRLANANYKARIIAAARPCNKCRHYGLGLKCVECGFEHTSWEHAADSTMSRRHKYEEL